MIFLFITWNLFAFSYMGIDKWKAVRQQYRISENTLILVSFLFGSIGILLGMLIFHHKIRKPKFYIIIPVLTILQAIILIKLVNFG